MTWKSCRSNFQAFAFKPRGSDKCFCKLRVADANVLRRFRILFMRPHQAIAVGGFTSRSPLALVWNWCHSGCFLFLLLERAYPPCQRSQPTVRPAVGARDAAQPLVADHCCRTLTLTFSSPCQKPEIHPQAGAARRTVTQRQVPPLPRLWPQFGHGRNRTKFGLELLVAPRGSRGNFRVLQCAGPNPFV